MIESPPTSPAQPSELALAGEPPEPFIFRTVQHQCPTKKMRLVVEEHIVENGVAPENFPHFTAPIRNMPIGQGPNGQMITINGDIPVKADGLVEAFEILPQVLNEEVPKLVTAVKKKIMAPKIVTPGASPNGEDFDWGGQRFKLGLSK